MRIPTKVRAAVAIVRAHVVAACLLAGSVTLAQIASAAERNPIVVHTHAAGAFDAGGAADQLLARARAEGELPVIVGLRMTLSQNGDLSPQALEAQGLALRDMQDRVTARILGQTQRPIDRYTLIPHMAFFANESELRRLLRDPDVVSVREDLPVSPLLEDSIPLIHADDTYQDYGVSGVNQVVAVLDTGVAKSHPALLGRVVSEACYSTQNPPETTSFCPGKARKSTAPGSGQNCPVKIAGCDHGTHVASIAAGEDNLRGVAFGARIIAIQVFSRDNTVEGCALIKKAPPCPRAFGKDLLNALHRVHELRGVYKIAAVNLSLGGGLFGADCDAQLTDLAGMFAQLRSAGIAPVVASGNDGANGGVSQPGCISTAVTVGNSLKADEETQLEFISKSSNHSKLIELMAPGDKILAAVPNGAKCIGGAGAHCKKSGTSMATPHVAGAFAMLRQARPSASVDDILDALKCSGKTVFQRPNRDDVRAKPRIDLLGAYNWLVKPPNVERKWKFEQNADGFDWTPFLGEWRAFGGGYEPMPVPTGVVMSSTANCNTSLEVTARVRRDYAVGGDDDPDVAPGAGVLLKSTLDYPNRENRDLSGYVFAYLYLPRAEPPESRGWGFVRRFDSGFGTTLCLETEDVPVKFLDWNTIRVVSEGASHRFYLNGKLICEVSDAAYESGPVGVITEFSTNYPTTGGTFEVDTLTIKSMDNGARTIAASTRPAITRGKEAHDGQVRTLIAVAAD